MRSIEAPGARRGGDPHVVALYGGAVHHVVGQAAIELRQSVDAAGGVAAQTSHGGGPQRVGLLVERQRKHRAMRQAIGGGEHFPLAVFVERQPVVGARPDLVAVHADAVHVIVGQPVGGGEVLPAKARQIFRQQSGGGARAERRESSFS